MFLYKTTPVACCCKAQVNGSCFVMKLWDKAERLWTRVKNWKTVRGWHIWKLKLVDARLYFVSMFVGLLTGLVAVPYHYLLYYLFHLRSGFFASHPAWYWHIPLFLFSWGILVFVMWLVGKMPLIGGGGIPQTRGVINGRITYRHPFIEMVSKFVGGILSFSAGLSLGREGPSVQIGSYVGSQVSRWTHILKGEQKQLLAAGAGAGLAAAFAAPLASSLIVIESIERFDAPKTAITTLLAGVVAGAVASMVFPVNPYHLIEVTEPVFAFFVQMKYFLILAVIVSVCGKFYSSTMNAFRHVYAKVNSPAYVKMFYLVLVAYIISLMQVNLTGGGEQFLLAQAQNGSTQIMWVTAVMLLHFVFSVFSVSSGLPGGSFIPTLVTGGLLGQIVGLVGVRYGVIGQENVSYIMLVSMSAFLVAVVRTPLTAIVLITEITGHFEVFYPSVVVGGLTYYFTELLQMKPSNVSLYEDMIHAPDFKEEKRYTLSVEIMTDSYLDGKLVDELSLPERCVIINVHRDGKNLVPAGTRLIPGDQVQIEMDSQDIEKLYEPLVSMANIY